MRAAQSPDSRRATMPWRELSPASKDDRASLRRSKRAKLYADADIEEEVVSWFRENGVNIRSARELGHQRKPDEFHAALSKRRGRFLLTKNSRDFLNDRKFPHRNFHGLIVIEGDLGPRSTDYGVAAAIVLRQIVPWGEVFVGSKIRVAAGTLVISGPDETGRIRVHRYKLEPNKQYEWVDD
jgi:hypothetical protein